MILGQELDKLLAENPLPNQLGCGFAQAYLTSDNSWSLRSSPIPSSDSSVWPNQAEFTNLEEEKRNTRAVKDNLREIALKHEVGADEITVAARVEFFSHRADYLYFMWFQEIFKGKPTLGMSAPTTLSGRTFQIDSPDWWEPEIEQGLRPVTYAVGGHNRLMISFPQFLPSKIWKLEFEWYPSAENPMIWFCGDQVVARYECIHGPLRSTQSRHCRQPLLHRWVAKKDAFEKALIRLSDAKFFEDFEVSYTAND